MVEIDRGTMPVQRSDIEQTSIARKLRGYLAAHTAKEHQRQFGWKNFRVLMMTTDQRRLSSMIEASSRTKSKGGIGASLFLFATHGDFFANDPLIGPWIDSNSRKTALTV
jgi:hypothetical protein